MRDEVKTKKQLITELYEMRQFVGEILNYPKDSLNSVALKSLKEAARNMKQSHEKFVKSFMQNTVPMVLTIQNNGDFVEVNEAFLKITGFTRDKVIGNTMAGLGLITEEQESATFNKLAKRGRIENYELEIKAKSGRLVNGLINMVIMILDKEKYVLTVIIDITERKGENEQRFSHLPIYQPMPWFIS